MPLSRRTLLILGLGCGVIVLSLGITAAVLGAKGYFGYDDPCIGVYDFNITGLDLTGRGGADNNNNNDADDSSGGLFAGLIDGVTESLGLGSVSDLLPTQASLTIALIMEVNNTNPYDMDFKQTDDGIISIPDDRSVATLESRQGEDPEVDGFVVGAWKMPSGTLKKKARNLITVTVDTKIDLLSTDALGLAGTFASDGPLAFEVDGGIEGQGWVPGIAGKTKLFCMARVDNVIQAASGTQDATIRCKHSTKVGRRRLRGLQGGSGEVEYVDNLWALLGEDDEVDPSCYV